MFKFLSLSCAIILMTINLQAQQQSDTVKCFVQIMIPASGTIGMSKEIEDNQVFLNGGILLYTKAYAIKEGDKYVNSYPQEKKNLRIFGCRMKNRS